MIKDIGTEGLRVDIKAEHNDTLEQAAVKLNDTCADFKLKILGRFINGILSSTESTGPK